jgi:transposase-like protein
MTPREIEDLYLRRNARRRHPSPICRSCNRPFDREDRDPFDKHVCTTCGINRLEKAVRRLFQARGKKARKRALRRLMSLSK